MKGAHGLVARAAAVPDVDRRDLLGPRAHDARAAVDELRRAEVQAADAVAARHGLHRLLVQPPTAVPPKLRFGSDDALLLTTYVVRPGATKTYQAKMAAIYALMMNEQTRSKPS